MQKNGTFLGLPYDWRSISGKRVKKRIWNKNDHRLFTPKSFGWGYGINWYELIHRRKLLSVSILILIVLGIFIRQQVVKLKKAHSTFENYYAFRGCTKLIKRTSRYGLCQLPSGQTIKIVEFQGKWYVNNDLPFCVSNICF